MSPDSHYRRSIAFTLVVLAVVAIAVVGGPAVGPAMAQQANEPPVAAFDYSPTNPEPGQTIGLNASASTDPDGEIATYRWDFDNDGQTDAEGGPNQRIAFPSAGTYTVALTVVDNDGATNTTTRQIEVVGDEPPVARLNATPSEVAPGETVTLDATGSSDPDGRIVTWELDTDGDGTFDESYDSPTTLRVSYSEPGTYEITLRVTDNNDLTDTTTVTVVVEATSPTPGDGTPTAESPAGGTVTVTPAADGGLLPGGRLVAGLLVGALVLLLVIGGFVLYTRSGTGRRGGSDSGGALGSVGMAVLLVAILVGIPVALIRNQFATAATVGTDAALATLQLVALALVAVLVLLYVLFRYGTERAAGQGGDINSNRRNGLELPDLALGLVTVASSLLTAGAAILVSASNLPSMLLVVAAIVVGVLAFVPLTLAFEFVTRLRG